MMGKQRQLKVCGSLTMLFQSSRLKPGCQEKGLDGQSLGCSREQELILEAGVTVRVVTGAARSVFYIFPLGNTVQIQSFSLKLDCRVSVLPTPLRHFEMHCRRHVQTAWESVLDVQPGKDNKNLIALQQNRVSIGIRQKVLKRSTGSHCPKHYEISFTGGIKICWGKYILACIST